jgi:hypothetical protein
MAEPLDRRYNRARKPTVHFDEKIVPKQPAKPAKAPKSTKSTESAKSTQKSKNLATQPTQVPESDDVIEELCNQTQDLDIKDGPKGKKKAKAAEIARLNRLSLQKIMEEPKLLILESDESQKSMFLTLLILKIPWNYWTFLFPLKSVR